MRDLMRSLDLTHAQLDVLSLLQHPQDVDQLCDCTEESATALKSLTLAAFNFSHRLETLYLTSDAVSSLDFFRAASSSQSGTIWPRLSNLCIKDVVSCDCDLDSQHIPFTCTPLRDLATVVTRSLDHMSKIRRLNVVFYCSGIGIVSWLGLSANGFRKHSRT